MGFHFGIAAVAVLAGGITEYSDRMRFGHTTALIAGVASGGFGGLVGNQGGIRSAAMLGLGLHGPAFVAAATAIALAVDAARMPFYFITEPKEIFTASGAIAAAQVGGIIGMLAGARAPPNPAACIEKGRRRGAVGDRVLLLVLSGRLPK
jgi:hypothetical protein